MALHVDSIMGARVVKLSVFEIVEFVVIFGALLWFVWRHLADGLPEDFLTRLKGSEKGTFSQRVKARADKIRIWMHSVHDQES